ncbi:hypothetical protein ONS95_008034 [Cadophora gregata]|uniref:uncharacterized protein n=1 Tax=Cadophora gregata TaxID=51156 RepID=UPI0026DBCBA2|nr:uncharacterized protein ONS95_008034 [Cadophora gregata]KAK0119177.1 hypothetical protein ONS96_012241 [Cadophora gregata f. sp. sojae]KAK0126434.1 hypothetical protein ONS95_008034 [Cadophora gregata]
MSPPISSFSKLSITPAMQSSRGHAGGHSGEKGKGNAVPIDEEPSSSEHSSDEESDGSDPDDDNLEEEIDTTCRVFALDHCRQHGTRYAFQIAYAEVERYSIRISTTDSGKPTCSCKEPGTCLHITWFLEQLSRTRPLAAGDEVQGVTPYEHISHLGLDNVCEELHWELRQGTDSDAEETQWQLMKAYSTVQVGRQTRGVIKERLKTVRDILATFSEIDTDSYRQDLFKSGDEITLEPVLVRRDLEATVAKILVMDDSIFNHFQTLVSHNTRATEYFIKMGAKAQTTLELLDRYCEIGPSSGQHDLISSAQTLVNIVHAIDTNASERQPLSPASRVEAAKALVSILSMVVRERNHDAYQNSTWPRRRPHGELSIDRNLYERLIGTTSRTSPAGGNFVIDALQPLPEARHFVEELEEILAILGTIGWGPAPQAYREKLGALISQLKGSGLSMSSGKRPAGSLDRKVKRMK